MCRSIALRICPFRFGEPSQMVMPPHVRLCEIQVRLGSQRQAYVVNSFAACAPISGSVCHRPHLNANDLFESMSPTWVEPRFSPEGTPL